jgi:protein SEY1
LTELEAQASLHQQAIDAGNPVQALGQLMKQWSSEALGRCLTNFCSFILTMTYLARYDVDASHYGQDVHQRKREDLIASIESMLSPLSVGQFKLLHRDCLLAFEQELLVGVHLGERDFTELAKESCNRWQNVFEESAREAAVRGTEKTLETELELLKGDFSRVVDQTKEDGIIDTYMVSAIGVARARFTLLGNRKPFGTTSPFLLTVT